MRLRPRIEGPEPNLKIAHPALRSETDANRWQRRGCPAPQLARPTAAMVGVEHHAQDLGRILVQAQADLAQIRSSLALESGGATDSRLLAVVERVEAEMRMKADAVLQTVVHGSPATLPSLNSYNFAGASAPALAAPGALPNTRSASRVQLPVRSRSGPSAQTQTKRQQQQLASALVNPTSASSRAYLANRFGVAAPPPPPLSSEARRPVGKTAAGKLSAAKTSGPLGVLGGEYRRDPGAEPPIRPRDVAAGLLSLTQRGLLPPHVDLTPAIAREPAPVTQAPSRLHDPRTQFTPSGAAAYTSPFGFTIANTKLDLLSDVGPTFAETGPTKPSTKPPAPAKPPAAPAPAASPVTLSLGGAATRPTPGEEAAAALAAAEAQKARDFDQLMDTFSLHHFIIRRGSTVQTTPEYLSFGRKYSSEWGAVLQLVHKLEDMLKKYAVPLAYVDGQKLVALARDGLVPRTERALLACLVNDDQVATPAQGRTQNTLSQPQNVSPTSPSHLCLPLIPRPSYHTCRPATPWNRPPPLPALNPFSSSPPPSHSHRWLSALTFPASASGARARRPPARPCSRYRRGAAAGWRYAPWRTGSVCMSPQHGLLSVGLPRRCGRRCGRGSLPTRPSGGGRGMRCRTVLHATGPRRKSHRAWWCTSRRCRIPKRPAPRCRI